MVLKRKSIDSRLKISGMTEGVESLNASITPCLSPLNGSIALIRHPGNF